MCRCRHRWESLERTPSETVGRAVIGRRRDRERANGRARRRRPPSSHTHTHTHTHRHTLNLTHRAIFWRSVDVPVLWNGRLCRMAKTKDCCCSMDVGFRIETVYFFFFAIIGSVTPQITVSSIDTIHTHTFFCFLFLLFLPLSLSSTSWNSFFVIFNSF